MILMSGGKSRCVRENRSLVSHAVQPRPRASRGSAHAPSSKLGTQTLYRQCLLLLPAPSYSSIVSSFLDRSHASTVLLFRAVQGSPCAICFHQRRTVSLSDAHTPDAPPDIPPPGRS